MKGDIWRLESMEGQRWTISKLVDCDLEVGYNVLADSPCRLVPTEDVHAQVLAFLWKHAFSVDEGSRHGRIGENDYSGACSQGPSVVVTCERFAKRFIAKPAWIPELLRIWGPSFVAEFFIGLETLGGYYDARWEEFTDPGYSWYSPPLMVSSPHDRVTEEPKYVRGSLPDETKYHDESEAATILPHLHLIGYMHAISEIAERAKHPSCRAAAAQIIRERAAAHQLLLFTHKA